MKPTRKATGRSSPEQSRPAVSVVVPCRNERRHVEACIRSILNQTPPAGGMEILVVDGMSDDGTRAVLDTLRGEHPGLLVLDNPNRITPSALNIGIRAARGEVIAILGAHTVYQPDYITNCLDLLAEHPEAVCVGGPIVHRGETAFGRAVAQAMSHPLGVGNARHRFAGYEGMAEGACFPVFRRRAFERVGMYDESLVRNQDDEFNLRLKLAGEQVYLSPRAACEYQVRERPRDLFRQYFLYGFWRVVVMRKHGQVAALRQLAPTLFLLAVVILFGVGLALSGPWRYIAIVLPGLYLLAAVASGVRVALLRGWSVGVRFPVVLMVVHTAYALGFLRGIFKGRIPPATREL